MKKRALSLVLCVVMVLSLAAVPASAAKTEKAGSFPDVQGHWGQSSVRRWSGYGVLNGNEKGEFNPDAQMTRAEFATMLVNLMGYTEKAVNRFADVKSGDWYADAILKLAAAGIMQGDGVNANPNAPISREEAAVLLCRTMGITPSRNATLNFADQNAVASWARDAVAALSERGMIAGVGGNQFAPAANITRASVAKMVDNMVAEYVVDQKQTITGEIKGVVIVAAESSVTLKDATLNENLIVAPKGEKADLLLSGKTVAEDLILSAPSVDLIVNRTASAGDIQVEGKKAKLTMYGDADAITTGSAADNASISISSGTTVDTLHLGGPKADLRLSGTVQTLLASGADGALNISGTAKEVYVDAYASGTKITANYAAKITKLQTTADQVTLSGSGTVQTMTVTGGKHITVAQETRVSKITNQGGSSVKVAGQTLAQGKSTSNSGYISSGGGTSYADIIKAELLDQRVSLLQDQGSFVPADALISGYTVSGIPSTTNGVTTVAVTINGTHLMQHQAGNGELGYWVGLGIPHVEGNQYIQKYGAAPEQAAEIVGYGDSRDGTALSNGKTYYLYYFDVSKLIDGADGERGYVAVKNQEKITVYHVDFSKVTLAPNFENMQVLVIKDKETYGKLPASYLADHPWKDEYAMDHEGGSACGLPWLAVVYDSNVKGDFAMQLYKDNMEITNQATFGTTQGVNTIGPRKYQLWHIATPAQPEGKDTLSQAEVYGTYAVVLTKDGQTQRVQAETFAKPNTTYYDITFHFDDGMTPDQTIQFESGKAVRAPAVPPRTGYTCTGWKNQGTNAVLSDGVTAADASVTYTAQWVANTQTLTYDNGGADGGPGKETASKQVAYGTRYGDLPEVTKSGYTLKGWYTQAVGGTQVTADTIMGAKDVTIYAQWDPAGLIAAAEHPFTAAPQGEDPYPLFQFNYRRLVADPMTVKLEVTARNSVVYRYTYAPASVNETAAIQWSLRDLSPQGDGDSPTGPAAEALERANDKLLPAGTVLTYTITATLNGNTVTLAGTETVTDAMLRQVWFTDGEASAYTPKTERDIRDALAAFSAGATTSDVAITLTAPLDIPAGKTLTLSAGTTLATGVAVTGKLVGVTGAKLVLSAGGLYRGLPAGTYVWADGAWTPENAVKLTAKAYDYSSHNGGKNQYITYTLAKPGTPIPLSTEPAPPNPFLIGADTVKAIGQKTPEGIVMRNLYTTGATLIPAAPNVELSPKAAEATPHNSGWTLARSIADSTQTWYFWTMDGAAHEVTIKVPKQINTQSEWSDTLIDTTNTGANVPVAPKK